MGLTTIRRLGMAMAGLLASSSLALAQQQVVQFYSGTGFYVSRSGDIVTNAHVLPNCSEIYVREAGGKPFSAELVNRNEELDLAIIRSSYKPSRVGALRHQDTVVQPGENVTVIGYPQEFSHSGTLHIEHSQVKSLHGPQGEPRWMQFNDSARQGNSGGPLLDNAGNVVGVVTGKATIYRRNELSAKDEEIDKSDIAITLPVLKSYLQQNGIYFQTKDSLLRISDYLVERQGQGFIVQVLCRLPST